jgi:hypothetical protein
MTLPREQSISSAKQSVTDWPATASSRSPSSVTIAVTVRGLARGQHADRIAGLDLPVAIRPEKPRKSRLGRLTHCTGRRNGLPDRRVVDLDRFQMLDQRLGPVYQGVFATVRGDIVALEAGDRHGGEALDADLGAKAA